MPPQETTPLFGGGDGPPEVQAPPAPAAGTTTSTGTTTAADSGSSTSSAPPRRPPPLNLLPYQDSFHNATTGGGGTRSNTPTFLSFASAKNFYLRQRRRHRTMVVIGLGIGLIALVWMTIGLIQRLWTLLSSSTGYHPLRRNNSTATARTTSNYTGPYQLIERQVGGELFQYYDFLDGPDSLGSAGFNVYVGPEQRAQQLNLIDVKIDSHDQLEYVYLRSRPGQVTENTTTLPLRESIRLEGKRRMNRGLFVLDVAWMPSGCGVWPAFWLTDEPSWPNHGEIDIVEGVNTQTVAKTALHTSESCSMYAHVPTYAHSGFWDRATGIPNTWTGELDYNTSVPADNCWVLAPHQWANQGCVMISKEPNTIGQPFNERGGGVYALEWDPTNHSIKSWVFPADQGLPDNLQDALSSATSVTSSADFANVIRPDPSTWGLPYAYFAIGDTTGCSADHFQNHRLIFNLAFCGNVAGNRFLRDCPNVAQEFLTLDSNGNPDPIATCNAYIASNPPELEEAYWKVRGVYVYERE